MVGFEKIAVIKKLLNLYIVSLKASPGTEHIANGLENINKELLEMMNELRDSERNIFSIADKIENNSNINVLIICEFARLIKLGQRDSIHELVKTAQDFVECEDISFNDKEIDNLYSEHGFLRKYDLIQRHIKIEKDDFFTEFKIRHQYYYLDKIQDNLEKLEAFDSETPMLQGECCNYLNCDRKVFLYLCEKYGIQPFQDVPGWCRDYDGTWYDSRKIRRLKGLYARCRINYKDKSIHSFYILERQINNHPDLFNGKSNKKVKGSNDILWCIRCGRSWVNVPKASCKPTV